MVAVTGNTVADGKVEVDSDVEAVSKCPHFSESAWNLLILEMLSTFGGYVWGLLEIRVLGFIFSW